MAQQVTLVPDKGKSSDSGILRNVGKIPGKPDVITLEIKYKRGCGINLEFKSNKDDQTMVDLEKTAKACSYIFHLHRQFVWKFQNLRYRKFKKDSATTFAVNDYVFGGLKPDPLGCVDGTKCVHMMPVCIKDFDQKELESLRSSYSSFYLTLDEDFDDEENEEVLSMQLDFILKDYQRCSRKYAQLMDDAREKNLVIRTFLTYHRFFEVIDNELDKQGLPTRDVVANLWKVEQYFNYNTIHCSHEKYSQALFDVLVKEEYIKGDFKDRKAYAVSFGHYSNDTCDPASRLADKNLEALRERYDWKAW